MGYVLIAAILVFWFLFRTILPNFKVDIIMIHTQLGWIAIILLLIAAEISFKLKVQTKKLEEMIKEQKEISNILRISLPRINEEIKK